MGTVVKDARQRLNSDRGQAHRCALWQARRGTVLLTRGEKPKQSEKSQTYKLNSHCSIIRRRCALRSPNTGVGSHRARTPLHTTYALIAAPRSAHVWPDRGHTSARKLTPAPAHSLLFFGMRRTMTSLSYGDSND